MAGVAYATVTKLFDKGHLSPMKSDPACNIRDNIRVATHVDDYLTLTRSDDLVELTQALEQSVEIDHKGLPTSFLNIECHWKENSPALTQKRAIDSLSTEYGIIYGASTPMSPTADLTPPDPEKENVIDPKRYQRLIGSCTSLRRHAQISCTLSPTSHGAA